MTKLKPVEVQDFLNSLAAKKNDVGELIVADLRKEIKNWRTPAPVTVDVKAEIKSAPPVQTVLKLPPPSFHIIPATLQVAADEAGIDIEMNFGRALQLPNADIFLSPLNLSTLKKYSSIATSVIYKNGIC